MPAEPGSAPQRPGKTLSVGMGEVVVTAEPGDMLVSYGLGSCVAVAARDPVTRVSGLAHIVLPDSGMSRGGDGAARFADTAVPLLIREMERRGCDRRRLVVRVVGGANMFAAARPRGLLDVGAKNVEAVSQALAREGIKVAVRDVGGCAGRTFRLDVATGTATVRVAGGGERRI